MKAVQILTHVLIAVLVAVIVHYILEGLESRNKTTGTVVKPDCGCGCGGGCGN